MSKLIFDAQPGIPVAGFKLTKPDWEDNNNVRASRNPGHCATLTTYPLVAENGSKGLPHVEPVLAQPNRRPRWTGDEMIGGKTPTTRQEKDPLAGELLR